MIPMTTTNANPIHIHEVQTQNGDWTTLPVIRNLQEAKKLAPHFPAIVTAGPQAREVDFGHDNHLVQTFGDVDWKCWQAPTQEHVEAIIKFGLKNDVVLVHCHAGMSRSTSTAIGILLARGVEAELAVSSLAAIHPDDRPFIPNRLVIKILAEMYDIPELPQIARRYEWY